ncbi:MAG: NAD+ synthase [Desulfurococcales archaeon]|nr:NAD+ synthase [Desulfurococcales archaeon]
MGLVEKITINDVVSIDYGKAAEKIAEFIADRVESAGAKGVVLGVSGGVDSATVLFLSVKALGKDRVTALIMPDALVTPSKDVEDAKNLTELVGVKTHIVNISPIVDVYKSSLPIYEDEEKDKVPLGNLRARIRMTILYYYANKNNLLVAGTGDRSEILIGYFTKYGDGAVDMLPIGILYKSQVRRLAEYLGVPRDIAFKPSSPRLWPGQTAEGELGISYDEIDVILYSLFDKNIPLEKIPDYTGISLEKVRKVYELYVKSEHKRRMPPTPPLDIVARS